MPIKRLLLLCLLALLAGYPLWAKSGPIRGRVTGTDRKPLPYASVGLHRAADSSLVKSEFTDEDGVFEFLPTLPGKYYVSVALLGYDRYLTPSFDWASDALELPTLQLQPAAAHALQEVEIVGRKPLFERLPGRTVVNVDGSPLAAGSTTLDVLARSPGIRVDPSDNISLRGRQGVLVLLDGKRLPMSGSELADLLRGLPAEQIASIELITNPPAGFDAQGNAGIIAIHMKKDQRQGTNGSVNGSFGQGFYPKFNSGLSLNHRQGKVNLFGSYAYTDRRGIADLVLHRDFRENDTLTGTTDQFNKPRIHVVSHTARFGADYMPGKRTTLGIAFNGMLNDAHRYGASTTHQYSPEGERVGFYSTANDRRSSNPYGALNLNYRHSFADSAHAAQLTADLDYARYRSTNHQSLDNHYGYPVNRLPLLLTGDQTGDLTIQSAKVDFVRPLPGGARLEAGVKASQVYSDNDVRFWQTQGGQTVLDTGLTNHFRYTENINAAYVSLSRPAPWGSWQLGLRTEQTNAVGRQEVHDQNFDRHYTQVFPTAGLSYRAGKDHELGFSLGRRIERPTYNQLNPFRAYIDATTYGVGNPYLYPQTTYNIELTHTFRQHFTTGLRAGIDTRPIIGTVQPDGTNSRMVASTSQNLDRFYLLNPSFNMNLEPVKGWQMFNDVQVYYSRITGYVADTRLDRVQLSCEISSNHTFTLGHDWAADLEGYYQSPNIYGFLSVKTLGQVSFGVQKTFWSRKATLKLNMADVFYTMPIRATSTYTHYTEQFKQSFDTRVITVAFTFRFGNEKVPPARRRNGGAEDEMRRAG